MSYFHSFGMRFEQRELRPADQLPEVTVKTHEVLTQVDCRSGKPGVWHRISAEALFKAKLPQTRPLRPKRCEVDTRCRKKCIDKGHGVLDRSWLSEDLRTAHQSQKTGKHHGH